MTLSPARTVHDAHEFMLIREIVQGRRDLFDALIEPHLEPLLHIIRRMTGAHPDLEDIVQQSVMKAFVSLAQFRGEASFRTWLVRIGLNEVRQWRRARGDWHLVPLDPDIPRVEMRDHRLSPWDVCRQNQLVSRVHSAAEQLPVKYRAVFQFDLQEMSVGETARRLGLNISTVKTRRLRARTRIATLLRGRSGSKPRSSTSLKRVGTH